MKLEWVNETDLLLKLESPPSPAQTEWLLAARERLTGAFPHVLHDAVIAYDTLLLTWAPPFAEAPENLAAVQDCLAGVPDHSMVPARGKRVTLPAWYSAESGADLGAVADACGMTPDAVIRAHSDIEYHVYATGFAPGFAFLGDLPEALALPRHATPRRRVPAGSVAIAERQTAVYPMASPGGWHLIGLCPLRLFQPELPAEQANLLHPGDRVCFEPIDRARYEALRGAENE